MSRPSELVDVEFKISLKARSRGRHAEDYCEKLLLAMAFGLETQHPSWKITFEKTVKK